MNNKQTIGQRKPIAPWLSLDLKDKHVVLRVDFNIAANDDSRLWLHVPTIRELIAQHVKKITIISHFQRPQGRVVEEMSLAPLVPKLASALDMPVAFIPHGHTIQDAANSPETICLMENLRFHTGEEANNDHFALSLTTPASLVIMDAFSVCHRAHASTKGVMKHCPVMAGPALETEWKALESIIHDPIQPKVAIVGGAKINTKLPVIKALLKKVDTLCLAGRLALTVLIAYHESRGGVHAEVSKALQSRLDFSPQLLDMARDIVAVGSEKLLLPSDIVWTNDLENPDKIETFAVTDTHRVPSDMKGAPDIGIQTSNAIIAHIHKARLVLWNGPLGAFEFEGFDTSTLAIAQAAAEATRNNIRVVAGGGDTLSALRKAKLRGQLYYESLSGGAFLEFIENDGYLPGLFIDE